MSIPITIEIQGREKLRRDLLALGAKARPLARKAVRVAMKPVLEGARARVPVDSGRLSASLGELVESKRDAFTARVGTRRDFVYRDTSGAQVVHGRGKGKRVLRAYQRGARKDTKTAQQYGRVIEFGFDKRGRLKRKAGPALFLTRSIDDRIHSTVALLADELRRGIDSTTPS